MRKFIYFLALAGGISAVLLYAAPAAAQTPIESGGRSSDYQPPTRNPQGSSPSALQPTGSNNVQPAPSLLYPHALTKSGGLKVLTSPDGGAITTAGESDQADKSSGQLAIWIVGGFLTFMLVIYVIAKPDKQPVIAAETIQPEPPTAAIKIKKSKKGGKKSSARKRKPTRR